jgi:aromatic ring-cleaving dioxygenase
VKQHAAHAEAPDQGLRRRDLVRRVADFLVRQDESSVAGERAQHVRRGPVRPCPGPALLPRTLRRELEARFAVRLGRWHDALVGPHTRSMYQVAFAPAEFARLVPWLMLNRGPLDVLVHPETGDDLVDHRDHAAWLGERLPLRLEALGGAD